MGEFASKGVAGSGLGLGIAGTALGLLNANGNGGGLLGGLFGGGNCQNAQAGMALNALAEKDAKIAELTAMRYSDNQNAAVYKQTLADNKTLRDEMYAYITPIAQESAANRERVAVRVEQSLPTLKMLGIVDEGKVDLDRASAAAYAALEEAGGKVELSGYMVDKADIDALLEIAKKHAVE